MREIMRNDEEYDPKFDEALLEHYDDLGDFTGYRNVIERMRQHGYEPRGPGAPQPGSRFYRER